MTATQMKFTILLVVALALGVLITWIDSQSGWDQDGKAVRNAVLPP